MAFIIFICAAVVSTHTSFPDVTNVTDVNAGRTLTHGGAGYIIFIVFMSMIWEGVAIALRFLNLPIVDRYIGAVLIVVSFTCMSVILPSLSIRESAQFKQCPACNGML